MRFFIDEKAESRWTEIKEYVLSIKDFTTEALLDEQLSNIVSLRDDSDSKDYFKDDEIVRKYKDLRRNNSTEDLITEAVEEKFYLLQDYGEHEWNEKVVHSIINGVSWANRWTGDEYA